MSIAKTITTDHGDVISTAEVSHTDNGQLLIHIVSKLGDYTHEHRVTVGAVDGRDGVTRIHHCPTCGSSEELKSTKDLTPEELQATIQKHLDEKRNEAMEVLVGRAKVAKVTSLLT